jgi:hypothetical protein
LHTVSCRYCQQSFQPSKFRSDQAVCGQPDCQRQRRTDDHRRRLQSDPVYHELVRDSQKTWRAEHPRYSTQHRAQNPVAAERNRQKQRQRDQKRRLANLDRNTSALDLKRSAAEVWLLGPLAKDLDRNTLASCKFFIVQPVVPTPGPRTILGEQRSGVPTGLPV